MELSESIKRIIHEFGKEVIAERRFVYMIADYYSFRDNPAEKRVLTAIVNEGYSTRLLDIKDGSDITLITSQIVEDVCKNWGYKEELVDKSVKTICEGLGYYDYKTTSVSLPNPSNKDVLENQSNINEKLYYLKPTDRLNTTRYIAYDAKGYYNFNTGSFMLLKGSLLSIANTDSTDLLSPDERHRKTLIDLYCHYDHPNYIVDKNIYCNTPNVAAFMVTGHTMMGLLFWKDSEGNSIYQDKRWKSINYGVYSRRLF